MYELMFYCIELETVITCRFMLEILKSILTGLDARIELRKQTEKQQLNLATSHQKKIKELKQECKEVFPVSLSLSCIPS